MGARSTVPTMKVRTFDAFHTDPTPTITWAGGIIKTTTSVGSNSEATSSSPDPAASK
ncbi:MAG: hypothetical protein ACYS80_05960 [Planctomycetota bacterium]